MKKINVLYKYSVYFTFKNKNVQLVFTLKSNSEKVAYQRINEILRCTYMRRQHLDTVDKILIKKDNQILDNMSYKIYLRKNALI